MPRRPLLLALLVLAMQAPFAPVPADARNQAPRHAVAVYGPLMRGAVMRFQAAYGLPVTGVADARTLAALHLPARRVLREGSQGTDVLRLQEALADRGFWGTMAPVHVVAPRGTQKHPLKRIFEPARQPHRPMATPRALPLPQPTVFMPLPTPTPIPLLTPTPEPTPTPMPVATPTPTPTPTPEEHLGPGLELRGGVWNAATLDNPANVAIAPVGEGTVWLGNFGLGADFAMLPTGNGTPMLDVVLAHRPWQGLREFLGYQTLGFGTKNLGTLGVEAEFGSWVRLRLKAQGASDFGSGYLADGQLGLMFVFGPVGLDLGGRWLHADSAATLGQAAGATQSDLVGPYANLQLAF